MVFLRCCLLLIFLIVGSSVQTQSQGTDLYNLTISGTVLEADDEQLGKAQVVLICGTPGTKLEKGLYYRKNGAYIDDKIVTGKFSFDKVPRYADCYLGVVGEHHDDGLNKSSKIAWSMLTASRDLDFGVKILGQTQIDSPKKTVSINGRVMDAESGRVGEGDVFLFIYDPNHEGPEGPHPETGIAHMFKTNPDKMGTFSFTFDSNFTYKMGFWIGFLLNGLEDCYLIGKWNKKTSGTYTIDLGTISIEPD